MPLSDLDREQLYWGPDKKPLIRGDGVPFVDVIVDRWLRDELCGVCLSSFMPVPNSAGIGEGPVGARPRCWWTTQPIDEAVRAKAYAYLEKPVCTPDMHAWFEREQVEEAEARVREIEEGLSIAQLGLRGLKVRPAGWSIKRG